MLRLTRTAGRALPHLPLQAVKNDAELAGMREAHLRDGVALARFLCWLEAAIAGGAVLTEVEVSTFVIDRSVCLCVGCMPMGGRLSW